MDGIELPAIPVPGRLRLPGKLLSFLGFLVVVRYSCLIIHAVDQLAPPAMSSYSFTLEHEQLLVCYLVWTLGFLTMLLLPPLIANSPRLVLLEARVMNSLFPVFNPLVPIRLMDGLRFSPQFASYLGFLIAVRYSFLIIHAVDQVQASPPSMSSSFTVEHEQVLTYYLVWTLGLLTMLLPPLLHNSPRLMQLASLSMNSLFGPFVDEHA